MNRVRGLIALPILVSVLSAQGPIIRSDVREVQVPVVVTDKAGRYVTTLNRDDFQVFENGKPQTIVAFSKPFASPAVELPGSHDSSMAASAVRPPNVSETPKQTYLICIDTLHLPFDHFAHIRQALAAYFADEQPGDAQYVVAVLGRQMQVVLDSTRSPAAVLNVLNTKALVKGFQESEAPSVAPEVARFNGLVGHWCGACQCTSPEEDVANMACPTLKGEVQSALYSFAERATVLDGFFIQELKQAVAALSKMPTDRTVLLLSDGFNRYPGEELYAILRNASVGDIDLRSNPHDLQPQVNSVLMLAQKFDVRFYTIDSRGLYAGGEVPGTGESAADRGGNSQVAMSVAWMNSDVPAQLARQTGGGFFENSNDLEKGIRKTFEDSRERYLLVYTPSKPKPDNKFRKIVVKVNGADLHVAAKTGYWATR